MKLIDIYEIIISFPINFSSTIPCLKITFPCAPENYLCSIFAYLLKNNKTNPNEIYGLETSSRRSQGYIIRM